MKLMSFIAFVVRKILYKLVFTLFTLFANKCYNEENQDKFDIREAASRCITMCNFGINIYEKKFLPPIFK